MVNFYNNQLEIAISELVWVWVCALKALANASHYSRQQNSNFVFLQVALKLAQMAGLLQRGSSNYLVKAAEAPGTCVQL